MFYESLIRIDTGDNPNRPRPGRDWLANPYRVHQRIMWALDGETQVNRPVFRIYRDSVLVRSSTKPDWERAFTTPPHAATFMLADKALPSVKQCTPKLEAGGVHYFEVLIAAIRRAWLVEERSKDGKNLHLPSDPRYAELKEVADTKHRAKVIGDPDPHPEHAVRAKRIERSVHLSEEPDADGSTELVSDWFAKKLDGTGLRLTQGENNAPHVRLVDRLSVRAKKDKQPIILPAALVSGRVEIEDPKLAATALTDGIGRSKSLGLGMLILGRRLP